MDFKSLIKKFDTKPNNSKETIRFSTREPITTKNNIETQNEFKKADTPKNFEANSIMNQIYKSQDNEINMEKSRNTIANLPSSSNNNPFLSKISMFENKKNNNKQNNNKKDTQITKNTKDNKIKNSELVNNAPIKEIKKNENINENNKEIIKDNIKDNKKEIAETKAVKEDKEDNKQLIKETNMETKENNQKEIKEKENNNNEIIKIEKIEEKIYDNNDNKNENNNEIENINNEKNNIIIEDEKNNENMEEEKDIINKEENIEKSEINKDENIEENENDEQENDIIGKFRQENNNDNENNKNHKEEIQKELYNNIYDNIDDKDNEKEKEEENKDENEKEKKEDEDENKDKIEIKLKNEEKEEIKDNLIINNEKEKNEDIKEKQNININKDENEDNFEENLDITKLIQNKESINNENNKNFENQNNLEDYFKQQNGFEKTISNIELINQKPSLYVEDEMNDTLIKVSEKDKPKKGKEKNKKVNNIKNNIKDNNNIINTNKDKNINIYGDEKDEINEKDNNISNINNISNSEKTKQMKDLFDYDEDENLFKKFNSEEFPIRRYDSNTIDSGKKFFKFRFIKNKLEYYLKFSIMPNTTNKPFLDKSLSVSNVGLNRSINSFYKKSNTFQNDLTISNMNNYDKEKEIRIYSSEFLKIVEKSIFSFNLKKYKESYGYLLKNGIIYNPGEYGEFLLVVSGFDKNVMGDFLSKNHFPNDKKEALNSFTSCIDVEYPQKKILECTRFLFSKIDLPKDANLILEIINSFSLHYFNENKISKNFVNLFKSSNSIYLLLSTVLAINTMFIRTDIRNLNIITKEEFIKMNEVDGKVSEDIYLELKDNPISMIDDDYSQNTYKKLSQLVKEKTKIEGYRNESNNIYLENNDIIEEKNIFNEDNKNIINDEEDYRQRRMTFSLSQNFQEFTKADMEILSKPIKFLKFSGNNSSHTREFLVSDNFTKLIWAKSIHQNKFKGNLHFIMISDIIDIFNGIDNSEIIQKHFKANKEKEKNVYITIISKSRQIDLKAENLQSALIWFKALKSLIIKLKNKEEKKFEKQNMINNAKLKNKIGLIWKNSILPKWGEYGDYILFKIHEKKNDLYNLKFVNKSNNMNNIINDEKLPLAKKIELISKETENKKILSESDFFILYNLGLPFSVRSKIWKFLIGNPCNISKILYDSYMNQVEMVNFDNIDIKYHEDVNQVFSCDYIINQMIVDIIKIKDLFLCELISHKIEQNEAMLRAYRIIRIFFTIRNDLTYNKNIIPLIFIFLILGENEFNIFSNVYNLVCGTNLIKYLLGDEQFIKNSILFFNQLISKKIPRVWEHFKKLEITTELYLIPWFEEIFTGTLSYKILLRVLDLYLLNGDYILYQVGLTIIKIQEEEILNSTISEVFRVLRRLPNKYKEDFFLDCIKEFPDIKEKYFSWNKENILGEQKQLLFQDFYDEEE